MRKSVVLEFFRYVFWGLCVVILLLAVGMTSKRIRNAAVSQVNRLLREAEESFVDF